MWIPSTTGVEAAQYWGKDEDNRGNILHGLYPFVTTSQHRDGGEGTGDKDNIENKDSIVEVDQHTINCRGGLCTLQTCESHTALR
jgi:hypothetical protein